MDKNEQTTIEGFPCRKPKCKDREPFKTQQALAMHMIRVHTRAGRLGASRGGKAGAKARALSLRKQRNHASLRGHLDYCPFCGGHLAPIEIALGTMQRISHEQEASR